MNKIISPILVIGMLVFLAYSLIDRFIAPLSDWVAIPMMLAAIVLIIIGGLKTKNSDKR